MKFVSILAVGFAGLAAAAPSAISKRDNGVIQLNDHIFQGPNVEGADTTYKKDAPVHTVVSNQRASGTSKPSGMMAASNDGPGIMGGGWLCYNATKFSVTNQNLIRTIKDECADLTIEAFGPLPPSWRRVSTIEFNNYRVRFMLKNNRAGESLFVTYETCLAEMLALTTYCSQEYEHRAVRSGWLNSGDNSLTSEFLILKYLGH